MDGLEIVDFDAGVRASYIDGVCRGDQIDVPNGCISTSAVQLKIVEVRMGRRDYPGKRVSNKRTDRCVENDIVGLIGSLRVDHFFDLPVVRVGRVVESGAVIRKVCGVVVVDG